MGALDYKTRWHRRTRLAAGLAVTYHPRRHFRFGQDIGWHWQFDNPNDLYRRRNRATNTGFTLGTTGAVPTDWIERGLITGRKTVDATTQSGFCMRVTGGGGVVGGSDDVRLTTVTGLTIGATHTVRFKAKNAGGTQPIRIAMASTSADIAITSSWASYTFNAVATSATNGIFLGAAVAGAIYDVTDIEVLSQSDLSAPYQPITTWAQAYLDAVGAERIYAWKDTAGTDPVTAVGEGIGLLLGREYGGATGPSLLANGATGLTGTATAASYSTTTFAGSVSRAGDASNQSWVTWTGLTTSAVHRIRVTNTGATSLDVRNGGVAGTIVASIAAGASTWVHPATTGGSTSITITATANSTTATFTLGQFAVLPGTHLTQATGTAKPTLSARVNVLTYTEQFDSATWVKSRATVTANAATAPNGTLTADKLVEDTATGTHRIYQVTTKPSAVASSWVFSVSLKAAERGFATVKLTDNAEADQGAVGINLSTGAVSAFGGTFTSMSVTVVDEGDGWWRVKFTATCDTDSQLVAWVQVANSLGTSVSYTGDGTSGIYTWGADLRTADDAAKNIPAYQRVGATASDHDTDGYPHFVEGDGTDNAWASVATVDGSGSDKVTVVAAVTKNSDAAAGCVLELTANSGSTTHAFGMFAPSSAAANFNFGSHGSASVVQVTETGPASPKTAVLGGYADIAGDSVVLARDGVPVASSSTDQGTGNFANATLYALSRGGSSVRFNGRFYGSTGRFGPMSDSERNNLTRWWQKRIGTA